MLTLWLWPGVRTGPSALTPVWYIATDTRNYRLDTLTGALSRAEESGA